MAVLRDLVLPALSGLGGATIGAGASVWSQAITQRSAARREREARQHAHDLRRLDRDREHLQTLSDAIEAHDQLLLHYRSGTSKTTDVTASYARVLALAARTSHEETRRAAIGFLDLTASYVDGATGVDELSEAYRRAVITIGDVLRTEPFAP